MRTPLEPLAEYRLALRATAEAEARAARTKSTKDLRAVQLLQAYRLKLLPQLAVA